MMIWHGAKAKLAMKKATHDGLYDAIHFLRDEMDKIVPHDEGTLQRSGETVVQGDKASTGYDTPYAIRLHEHPEYNFRGNREGKWVEKTIKDPRIQKKIRNHIAKKIDRALR